MIGKERDALANEKLGRIVPLPTWQDALRRYLKPA
jgi:hypothetical protein